MSLTVTILMAVHNGEHYLRDAIRSILCQTFEEFEFLIVNDGSTDRTREIILSYDDPRIHLVDQQDRLGLPKSLNLGLRLAKGEFIARQDADDISEPQRLAKQVAFLEVRPDVALVGTWYKVIDSTGRQIGATKLPRDCLKIRWHLLFYNTFVHSSIMLRRSPVVGQVGLYDETFHYAQDYDLWCRIAGSLSVANVPEYLIQYRDHASSMTSTSPDKAKEEHRIREQNIGRLFGSIGSTETIDENSFKVISRLLFDFFHSKERLAAEAEDVRPAIIDVLRLASAFYRFYGIDRFDSRNHYARLCMRLASRLLSVSFSRVSQNDYEAGLKLFIEACRILWSMLNSQNRIPWSVGRAS